QDKYPQIIGTQTPPDGFPFRDRKTRRYEVFGNAFGPFLIRIYLPLRKHRREIADLYTADAVRPNFVIPVTPRFQKKKYRNEHCVYRDRKMRIVRRTEYERKCCAGRNDGPVRCRVEPGAPNVRPRDLAAVKLHHRGIEFRRREALNY